MTTRLIIVGGPQTGKTTLAMRMGKELGLLVRHTDDLIATHDWSGASLAASLWFEAPGPWCVEGVATVRALRKWIATHADGVPADRVLFLDEPWIEMTKGQQAMTKGVATVWAELLPELHRRRVQIATAGRIV